MTSTQKSPLKGQPPGRPMKPKPVKFNKAWRRWCSDSDAPVTLPKAPWEIEKDDHE